MQGAKIICALTRHKPDIRWVQNLQCNHITLCCRNRPPTCCCKIDCLSQGTYPSVYCFQKKTLIIIIPLSIQYWISSTWEHFTFILITVFIFQDCETSTADIVHELKIWECYNHVLCPNSGDVLISGGNWILRIYFLLDFVIYFKLTHILFFWYL